MNELALRTECSYASSPFCWYTNFILWSLLFPLNLKLIHKFIYCKCQVKADVWSQRLYKIVSIIFVFIKSWKTTKTETKIWKAFWRVRSNQKYRNNRISIQPTFRTSFRHLKSLTIYVVKVIFYVRNKSYIFS